jgi:hypothetical protein
VRARRLPAGLILAYAVPPALLVIGLGAAVTPGDDRIPGWMVAGLMLVMLALAIWMFRRGRRHLPTWQTLGSFPLLLVAAGLLDADERFFPVPLALAALLARSVWRAPPLAPPEPCGVQDPREVQDDAASMPTPHPVSPWASPPSNRPPQDQPSTSRVTIAGVGTVAFLGIVSLGLLILGGWVVHAAVTGRHLEPATTPVRVIGGVIGVVLALAGLAGATTTVELLISRGQSLVIDADGIRRKRLQGWSLDWSQIEAVSLTVGESILVRARAGRRCPRR